MPRLQRPSIEVLLKELPTPKTLDEAIEQMFHIPGPYIREAGYHILRDFLAQRFGAAELRNTPRPKQDALQDLFVEIVKRGDGK